MPPAEVVKLQRVASTWGGEIRVLSDDAWEEQAEIWREEANPDGKDLPPLKAFYSDCPFASSLGVNWRDKIIICTDKVLWPGLIHEMGHAFACPKPPGNAEEWPFFGWEYRLALRIRGDMRTWFHENRHYVVGFRGEIETFGHLRKPQKMEAVADSLAEGKREGLFDPQGRPVPVR